MSVANSKIRAFSHRNLNLFKYKIIFSILTLALITPLLSGCGRLWGGVNFYRTPSGGATSVYNILGIFVGTIGNTTASTGTCPAAGAAPAFCTGGTFASGAGDGMYNFSIGLSVDSANNVLYIADFFNHRIVKTNATTGEFIGAIGRTTATTGTCPAAGATNAWCTGGTFATGATDGMFNGPRGVKVDGANGFLYVADSGNHRIVKINSTTGAFVGAIGRTTATTGTCPAAGAAPGWCTGGTFASGATDGMFNNTGGVNIDTANGFLYVTDDNFRLAKISLVSGSFAGAVGKTTATTGTCTGAGAEPIWCTGGTFATGAADGMFSNSTVGIDVDSANRFIYVSDQNNNHLIKINSTTGAFIGSIGRTTASTGTCPAAGAAPGWCTGGTFASGIADGMFSSQIGVTLDSTTGYLYVANLLARRIDRIDSTTGAYLGAVGRTTASTGTCPIGVTTGWCTGGSFSAIFGDGGFNNPSSITVDSSRGALFIIDLGNSTIIKLM